MMSPQKSEHLRGSLERGEGGIGLNFDFVLLLSSGAFKTCVVGCSFPWDRVLTLEEVSDIFSIMPQPNKSTQSIGNDQRVRKRVMWIEKGNTHIDTETPEERNCEVKNKDL